MSIEAERADSPSSLMDINDKLVSDSPSGQTVSTLRSETHPDEDDSFNDSQATPEPGTIPSSSDDAAIIEDPYAHTTPKTPTVRLSNGCRIDNTALPEPPLSPKSSPSASPEPPLSPRSSPSASPPRRICNHSRAALKLQTTPFSDADSPTATTPKPIKRRIVHRPSPQPTTASDEPHQESLLLARRHLEDSTHRRRFQRAATPRLSADESSTTTAKKLSASEHSGLSPRMSTKPRHDRRRRLYPKWIGDYRPTLLERERSSSTVKSYKTNSSLMLQIKNDLEERPRKELEVPALVASIETELRKLVSRQDAGVVAYKLEPKGCRWQLTLNPFLNGADENFRLDVCLLAADGQGEAVTNYVVETALVSKTGGKVKTPNGERPRGYREAKQVLEFVRVAVRKAALRLEFPDLTTEVGPTFKEVYQLNAAVMKASRSVVVCRGKHRQTRKKVAIKCVLRRLLPPSQDAAVYDEISILSSMSRPKILDFFEEPSCYFIVFDLSTAPDSWGLSSLCRESEHLREQLEASLNLTSALEDFDLNEADGDEEKDGNEGEAIEETETTESDELD